MEENSSQKSNKTMMYVAAVVVVAVLAFGVYFAQNRVDSQTTGTTSSSGTQNITTPSSGREMGSAYTDGTYEAVGSYVSPGGPREINVSVTLANGLVSDTTFQGGADDPTSQRFQKEFADNYKAMVVGKPIDEIALTKVSGSSLTPKGFQDALAKIKMEASGS